MTAQKKVLAVLIGSLFVGSLLTACGGGSSSGVESPTSTAFSGTGVDGYLSGATVFLDINNNQAQDANEPSATTDESGKYTLSYTGVGELPATAKLIMFGGIDTGTGLPFSGVMFAKADRNDPSANITPLTTLLSALIDAGQTEEAASVKLSSVFGIDKNNIKADPMVLVAQDPAILQKSVAVQKAIEVLAAAEARGQDTASQVYTGATQKVGNLLAKSLMTESESSIAVDALIKNAVDTAVTANDTSFTNLTAVSNASSAAQATAKLTELVVADSVANLVADQSLTSLTNASDIANLVQLNVNTKIAGLAELQQQTIAAASQASTTAEQSFDLNSSDSNLTALINDALRATVKTLTLDNSSSVADNPFSSTIDAIAKPLELAVKTNEYVAGLAAVQVASSVNLRLPAGYSTLTLNNSNPSDGLVQVQANNGQNGIKINVPVTQAQDKLIATIEAYKSQLNATIAVADLTTTSSYTANLNSQQTSSSVNVVLPAGYIVGAVTNTNTQDGIVLIQANDGKGAVINIDVNVGSNDASIYDQASYATATGGAITSATAN